MPEVTVDTARGLCDAHVAIARAHAANTDRAQATAVQVRAEYERERTSLQENHQHELATLRNNHAAALEHIRDDVIGKYREGGAICPDGLREFLDRHRMTPLSRRFRATLEVELETEGELATEDPDDVARYYLTLTSDRGDLDLIGSPIVNGTRNL